MWGEPGHLYVYLSHGIHSCVNVVCAPAGVAGGVLLRAAEIVEGTEIATRRRFAAREPGPVRDLARGPGRLGQSLGLRHAAHDGVDAVTGAEQTVATGPRVGGAGVAGTDAYPWRFWIPGAPTVSAFRWGRGAQGARAAAVLD